MERACRTKLAVDERACWIAIAPAPAAAAASAFEALRFSNSRIKLALRAVVGLRSGSPPRTVRTIFRSDRVFPLIVEGRCCAFATYRSMSAPIVALSLLSFSGSALRPASVQKDSIICAAIRFAAAISFVPVLRETRLNAPGGLKRTCQSFLPAGGGCR